ncbi:alpha/beta hydrolase [Streptomyces sp. NBC_01092]|uniref:alpha/beta hydrolase n=1 Tax=Streptomyces sp. NBC_01092 TaxID=2903748 RepID=UPI00386F9695|nr:alpha/beta hydrolase [Streptomyces sp. NBC_01092]
MLGSDPVIDLRSTLSARALQLVFRPMFRYQSAGSRVQFATKPIAKPERITVPTRHGNVRTLLYSPTAESVAAWHAAGRRPPVHLIVHGGGFIVRVPMQEDNVARYLASEVGAYVLIPDYDTAPKVRFPVSEEQSYDVFRWIQANAQSQGWDGDRVSVGGPSAGGKHALSVVTMAIDDGGRLPVAVTAEYAAADMALAPSARTSAKRNPVVPPQLVDLIQRTYFKGVDLTSLLASPNRYSRLAEFPPTLVLTAEYDTLRDEMNALAADLAERGVQVTHRQFDGVDHGFTHFPPVEVAREAIAMIGEHLRKAYA